jgi:hypothetical protein
MKTKNSVAVVSASALAAGMAQGAVIESGPLNLQQNLGISDSRQAVDITGNSISDFTFGYDAANAMKPYIDTRTYVSTEIPLQSGAISVLSKANKGLPVTGLGVTIDASYAATYPGISNGRSYFFHDDGDALVGDWSNTQITEGYVGIQLELNGSTHYGWLNFINNPTADTPNLTLTGWAYESTPGVGIETSVVPEPSTLTLAAAGMASLLMLRKRRQ